MALTKTYKQAYKQVVAILDHLPDKDRKRIPDEKYEFYKQNMDVSFDWEFKEGLPPEKQDFLLETNAIMVTIFRDYFATQKQKEQLEVILERNDRIIKKKQYKELAEREKHK